MWRPSGQRTNYVLHLAWLGVMLTVALSASGCSRGRPFDRLRQDYVAQSYVRQAQAELMRAQPDYRRATGLANRALQLAPESVPVVRTAAGVFMQTQDWDRSLQALLALQERTGHTDLQGLGTACLYRGDTEQGRKLLEAYLSNQYSLRATGHISDVSLALVLNNVGYVYADAGIDLKRALALTQEAVRLMPQQGIFLDSLGWAYYRLGQYDSAAFYLERALRLQKPPVAEIFYHAGVVHAHQGEMRLARKELLRALSLRPRYEEAQYELQRLHWQLPQPQPV